MTLRFFFDYISPYAYLAWSRIHSLAERHGHTVEPTPVLFAALLNHHGHKGPAEIPAKRVYVFKDVLRSAAAIPIPLTPPPAHPFNPLLALRVTALDAPPSARRLLIDGLFQATWGGGPGVTDPAVVEQIANEVGIPDATLRAQSDEAKAQVRANTDEAIARGMWGVPTMLLGDELFWGYDSLAHLEQHLQGHDPVTNELLAVWHHLPVGASRT